MTDSTNDRNEEPEAAEALPPESPESQGALSIPPPVPRKEPGFFRRLFMSRKKQQAIAVQNGYLEMVDLIRAIRSHLDRQENVQTRVLSMLEKVPDAMERQHEVLSLFKQQLESNLDNDRRLSDSMGRLSGTLEAMDESQKSSSRTITDLITRSRESEQLLREVMRRAERRMTLLIAFFVLLVLGMGVYLVHWQNRGERLRAAGPEPVAEATVPAPETAPDLPAVVPTPDESPEADAAPAPEPLPADEPEAVEPEPVTPEPEAGAEQEKAVAPPPAEDAGEPQAEPAPEAKPRPRGRPRTRPEDAKAEPAPEPQAEPAEAPAVEDTPAAATEEPAAPEEDMAAEPAGKTIAEAAPQSDPPAGESSEEVRLHQLKAVISEAMLDAFGPADKAPVSRP